MVSFRDLRDLDPTAFTRAAERWQTLADQLGQHADSVAGHLTGLADWVGEAGDAAKSTISGQHTVLSDAAGQIDKIPSVLSTVGSTMTGLRQQLGAVLSSAHANGLVIDEQGAVSSLLPGPLGAVLAGHLSDRLRGILAAAEKADQQAASALRGLMAPASAPTPSSAPSAPGLPPASDTPAQVNAWWRGLSAQQQAAFLQADGAQLGALDGIPADVRDRANRVVLAADQARLSQQQAQLKAKPQPLDSADAATLADVNAKLGGLAAVQSRLNAPVSAGQQRAYLLGISTDGTGRAIVAMGDPDTASNVATYVPGTGARLAACGGDLQRADRMVVAAGNAGSTSTSVITWIGYNAPQSIIPEAAESHYAQDAVGELDRFQDGLRATHQGTPSHNTVIGHSYGTTVVGYAAKYGHLNANDVVFVASPGVGADNANELHLDGVPADQTGQHVYSTVAQHDPIQVAAGRFGPSPTDPDFGGHTFTSAPGAAGPWYELGWNPAVHSQYWDLGNPALANMGNVIAGKPTY